MPMNNHVFDDDDVEACKRCVSAVVYSARCKIEIFGSILSLSRGCRLKVTE